jgi:ubiquitin C-terminal hydrolase
MNAVVQALFSLPLFTEYILGQYAQKVYQPHTLSNYFGQLITALSSSQPGAVEVPEFCDVSWKGLDMPAGTPQDAREFTTMLLNTLIDQGAEKLAQLFGLYTQSFVTYTVTDSASTTPAEVHYALELPVPVQKQPVALEQLVAQFFSLQGVSNSGHETDILQQVTLAHTGAYVLISLKREKMDLLSNTIQKAFTPVSFNLSNLSFKDYFITSDDPSKNNLYQLQAFVIHVGTGAGGHYFSYAKRNNRWYRCDDTVMVPVTQEFIQAIAQRGYEASLEHTPVLLFYQAQ